SPRDRGRTDAGRPPRARCPKPPRRSFRRPGSGAANATTSNSVHSWRFSSSVRSPARGRGRERAHIAAPRHRPCRLECMKLEHAAGRDSRPPTHALRTRTHPARAAARPTEGRDRAEVRITHPERVIDASTGITKGELAAYFERSAALLLWHLADRPVALLRAPHGLDGERFFQKHAPAGRIAGARQLPASLDAGHERLLALDSPRALMGAAQMNTVELHTWNAQAHDIEHPDRLILDLDPGEGVDGRQLREAARLAHELLRSLDL